MDWIMEEIKAAAVIIGGAAILFVGFAIGDFFAGIGDWLFGNDKETTESSESR